MSGSPTMIRPVWYGVRWRGSCQESRVKVVSTGSPSLKRMIPDEVIHFAANIVAAFYDRQVLQKQLQNAGAPQGFGLLLEDLLISTLQKSNAAPAVDSLRILGVVLRDFMDLPPPVKDTFLGSRDEYFQARAAEI